MKEIRLKQVSKIKSEYVINLGNGTSNAFTSQRDANYFLAATNNFLTDKLHDLHMNYVDVFNLFHDNWFYFDNDRKTPKFQLKAIERECEKSLESIKELLALSVDRCGFTNGNYFVFIHFNKIADYLEAVIREIAQISQKRSNTNAIYKMDVILKRVLIARNELSNYGKRSTTKIFRVPTHISEDKSYSPDFNLAIVA